MHPLLILLCTLLALVAACFLAFVGAVAWLALGEASEDDGVDQWNR